MCVVFGHDRFYNNLSKKVASLPSPPEIIKLNKSGGAVEKDIAFMKSYSHSKVKQYFFGDPVYPLSPFSTSIAFDDLLLLRIGEGKFLFYR